MYDLFYQREIKKAPANLLDNENNALDTITTLKYLS